MPKPNNPRKINWYRTAIPAETLQALNERSDAKGLLQAGGHLGILFLTGTASFIAWHYGAWMSLLVALFLHATVASFYINGIHEMVHGTVFKSAWLNTLFINIYSFLDWSDHQRFWASHTEHHKYTLNRPDDMEVLLPTHHRLDWPGYGCRAIFNVHVLTDLKNTVQHHWRLALGQLPSNTWFMKIFPETYPEGREGLIRRAQIRLGLHMAITIVSMCYGLWIIPVIVSCSNLMGGKWLFYLCNNTQHSGLVDQVPDFRLSCRTIYLNPVARFLYWQMNYHIEHHMYAAVPCYNLRKCHEAIQHELPPIHNGLLSTWLEILNIQKRQEKEPDYQYVQPLPEHSPARYSEKDTAASPMSKCASGLSCDSASQSADPAMTSNAKLQKKAYRILECSICAFVYDESLGMPAEGIPAGTLWEEIPEDWICPDCGTTKANFNMVAISESKSVDTQEQTSSESSTVSGGQEETLVIVGSGLAAYTLAKECRQNGLQSKIIVLTRDAGELYSKPMLSNALAQSKSADALIQKTAQEMASACGMEVRTFTEVSSINPAAKTVTTNRDVLAYDKLVLALGARPHQLNHQNRDSADLIHINNIDDYRKFRIQLSPQGRVAIIGAGFIACEFANDLSLSGHQVLVVAPNVLPLSNVLPASINQELKDALVADGVEFSLSTSILSIERLENGRQKIVLSHGQVEEVDHILCAIGLQSNSELASAAGITVNKGIVIDDHCQTSAKDIYAIGDCCEFEGKVQRFILPLMNQVSVLAKVLTHQEAQLKDEVYPIVLKTPSFPIVAMLPKVGESGQWEVEGSSPNLVAKFRGEDGALLGYVLCGEARQRKLDLQVEMKVVGVSVM